ncbi:MAG: hypothetical protein WCX48_11395 [Bacteroidales bacterium]
MEFINSQDGIERTDPETFKFNTVFMSGFRLALRFIKIPDYHTQLTGNAKILWEVFEDYRKCEGKTEAGENLHPNSALAAQHRFDILSRGIPVAIFKYFFDSAYREVGDRMLWVLFQRRGEFRFPPHHLDPNCWYHDHFETLADASKHPEDPGGGGRITYGVVIPECQIVSADERAIVVKEILEPKKYFASIENIDHWVSIDSNRPTWTGNGWGYPVYAVYGNQSELERKTLLGD